MKLAAILVTTLLLGCTTTTSISTNLNEASQLQPKIVRQFAHGDVNLTIRNDDVLEIEFVNSTFNRLYKRDKERKAQEIATFASNNLPPASKVTTIVVKLADKSHSGAVSTSDSTTYEFVRAGLPTATP